MRFALLVALLTGCMFFGKKVGDREELAALAADLVAASLGAQERKVAWLGLRDAGGEKTEATRALDDYLVSALVRADVDFSLADSAQSKWPDGVVVQADSSGEYLFLGGRLEEDGEWMYVRIFAVGSSEQGIVQSVTRPIAARHVRDEVAERSRAAGLGGDGLPLGVELHLVALRSEGGVRRRVELSDGAALREGDKVQVRFRLSRDAQVYAFLYSSEGEVISLAADEYRYSGLLHYGPSENGTVGLNEVDRVYTLYFLAGPRLLEENTSEFFDRLGELVEQGQVDRFTGLEKQDDLLVSFLRRSYRGEIAVEVVRSEAGLAKEEAETFVYSDGTRLQSRAEVLRGTPLVVRALSFVVE